MALKPDFLIIGAGRTGTTWLRNTLAASSRFILIKPELEYLLSIGDIEARMNAAYEAPRLVGGISPEDAELRISQGDAEAAAIRSQPYSSASQRERLVGQAEMARVRLGEKSPRHLLAPVEAIRELRRICPDAKLVVGVREPVSRALSGLVNRNVDYTRPVADEVLAKVLPDSRYAHHLRRWASVFHPSQFILYSFERLQSAPEETVSEICIRLGAGWWPIPPLSAPRASLSRPQQHPSGTPHPTVLERLQREVGGELYDLKSLKSLIIEVHQHTTRTAA